MNYFISTGVFNILIKLEWKVTYMKIITGMDILD